MICRQVQKVSRGCGPRASESPAMARWKACEWTFASAGSRSSTRWPSAAAPGATAAIRPSAPISTRTFSAQLSGSSARSAQITVTVTSLPHLPRRAAKISLDISGH